jgi:hypothetical protein
LAPSAEIALHNGTASDRANRRIFVQIPAYRDPELSPTLHDLFSKARNPEALRVAVLWQRAPDDRVEREVLRRKNLEIIDVSYRDSKVVTGRGTCSSVYGRERLYIDTGLAS